MPEDEANAASHLKISQGDITSLTGAGMLDLSCAEFYPIRVRLSNPAHFPSIERVRPNPSIESCEHSQGMNIIGKFSLK